MLPLITTIIPTYRRPLLLKRAILSALSQTYPHIRVLVLDNASGDETEKVVQSIANQDSRVTYHRHLQNIGSYPNFNYGMSRVETPFFSFLSDDDMLLPHFYEKALGCFHSYPDAMLVCMGVMVMDTEYLVRAYSHLPDVVTYYPAGEALIDALAGNKIELTWTGTLYRTEVAKLLGPINERAGPLADKAFNIRTATKCALVAHPSIAGILMAHRGSTSSSMDPIGSHREAWRKIWIKDILDDPHISERLKKYASEHVMLDNTIKTALLQMIRALREKDWKYAQKVVSGVERAYSRWHALLFKALLFSYRAILPFRLFLSAGIALSRALHISSLRRQTRKFKTIVDFVLELNRQAGIRDYTKL